MKVFNRYEQTRIHGSDPIGKLIFAVLRAVDPILQYWLISSGVGVMIVNFLGANQIQNIENHQSGFVMQPVQRLMVLCALVSAMKHIYWVLFVSEQKFDYGMATMIGTFNLVVNSINTLASLYRLSYANEIGLEQIVGCLLFIVGIFIEFYSEEQRRSFKNNPANKGRLYTSGLFSAARHINFCGYLIWRSGAALSSGSVILFLLTVGYWIFYFKTQAIPKLAHWMDSKYKEQWKKYKIQTPFELLPFFT